MRPQNSAIVRWDLVCERRQFPRYIQMTFFVGNLVGVALSGPFADNFGRKLAFNVFFTLWFLSGLFGWYADGLYAWTFARFCVGAFSLGFNNIIAAWAIELTHGKYRSICGHIFGELFWNVGHLVLGGVVYLCRDMINLQLLIACCGAPWLLLWFVMPESPRWLLSKGKSEEAKRVLRHACKLNGRSAEPVDAFVDNYVDDLDEEQGSIVDLFRWPAMRRNSILMSLCWLSFSMGYFGLIYNTPSFGWNIFLVFVFPTFIIIPMAIVQPFFENKLGRKLNLTFSLLLAGTMLLLTTAVPSSATMGVIVLAWIGTVACSSAFGVGYNFTREIFPTLLRTTALSMCSSTARIGSIISPLIAMLDAYNELLPLIVYGLIVISTGVMSIWIWPETRKIPLPETVEACEAMSATPNEWVAKLTCRKTDAAKSASGGGGIVMVERKGDNA